jgi:hypothetical protein
MFFGESFGADAPRRRSNVLNFQLFYKSRVSTKLYRLTQALGQPALLVSAHAIEVENVHA